MHMTYPALEGIVRQIAQFVDDNPYLELVPEYREVLTRTHNVSFPVLIGTDNQHLLSQILNQVFEEQILPQKFLASSSYFQVANSVSTRIEAVFADGRSEILTPLPNVIEKYSGKDNQTPIFFRIQTPLPALRPTVQFATANLAEPSIRKNSLLLGGTRALIWIAKDENVSISAELIEFINHVQHLSEIVLVVSSDSQTAKLALTEAVTAMRDLTKTAIPVQGISIPIDAKNAAWQSLVDHIHRLVDSYVSGSKAITVDDLIKLIDQIKQQIRKPESKASTTRTPDRDDVMRTYSLINKMIDDQADDIRQTIKDSFDVEVFQLKKRLESDKGGTPDAVVRSTFEAWLVKETERLERRINRLYEVSLDEAGRAIYQTLRLQPLITPIKLETANFTIDSAPTSDDGNSSIMARLAMAMGGGTLTSLAMRTLWDFTGILGWGTVIVVGSVVGTIVWIITDQQRSGKATAGSPPKQRAQGFSQPKGFDENIQENAQRLKIYIKEALMKVADGVDRESVSSPQIIALEAIEAELRQLGV